MFDAGPEGTVLEYRHHGARVDGSGVEDVGEESLRRELAARCAMGEHAFDPSLGVVPTRQWPRMPQDWRGRRDGRGRPRYRGNPPPPGVTSRRAIFRHTR